MFGLVGEEKHSTTSTCILLINNRSFSHAIKCSEKWEWLGIREEPHGKMYIEVGSTCPIIGSEMQQESLGLFGPCLGAHFASSREETDWKTCLIDIWFCFEDWSSDNTPCFPLGEAFRLAWNSKEGLSFKSVTGQDQSRHQYKLLFMFDPLTT